MPDYRLYLMNPHSGHIDGVETFHSGDDVEAILLVQGRRREVPVELWCGSRKVIHVDAPPEMLAPRAPARAVRRPDRAARKPEAETTPEAGADAAPAPGPEPTVVPKQKTAA